MTAAVARSRTATNRSSQRQRAGTGSSRSRVRTTSTRTNVVRPQLKVLDQEAIRRRGRRRNLAMTLFMVVIIGFFAAALAQAQLVANQHELDLLRTQIAEAEADRARLERQVEESSAPSAIIDRAYEIGMVRANDPIYLAATTAAPEVSVISTIGSATATTDALRGTEVAIDGSGGEHAAASLIADTVVNTVVDTASAADADLASPMIASIAGTRAIATGLSTG